MNELQRLREHIRQLGWSFSVWDAACQLSGQRDGGPQLCSRLHGGVPCLADDEAAARQAIEKGQPIVGRGPCGCAKLALPFHQRRRLLGAVVTGFPTRAMGDEPALRKLCAQRQANFEDLRALAEAECRYSEKDADHFIQILQWLLDDEHALEVSRHELTTLSDNLTSTYEELSLVYSISSAMKVTQRPSDFLQGVCRELTEVMDVSAVVALAYGHPSSGDEDDLVIGGDFDLSRPQVQLFCSTQVAPQLAASIKPMVRNAFKADPASGLGNAIRNFVAAPLSADKGLIGMLVAINKRGGQRGSGDFDTTDMKLLGSIASQASVFLANHRLFADLQDLLMGVLHALTATIDAKDPYTCGHSQRVALITRKLAEMCELPAEKVQQLYLMGLLHDIGKIGVPEAVLCKPGRLTDEEFETIKRHPAVGAKILGGIRQLEHVIAGILTHHERLDGRGYPRRLKGSDVPFEGLIVGLADCFDAMTSNRTYRAALPLNVVVEEIRRHAGTQFDPRLVEKLLSLDLEKYLAEIHAPSRTDLSILPMNHEQAAGSAAVAPVGEPAPAEVAG